MGLLESGLGLISGRFSVDMIMRTIFMAVSIIGGSNLGCPCNENPAV